MHTPHQEIETFFFKATYKQPGPLLPSFCLAFGFAVLFRVHLSNEVENQVCNDLCIFHVMLATGRAGRYNQHPGRYNQHPGALLFTANLILVTS